jgi:AcrR family transcriptional regulator
MPDLNRSSSTRRPRGRPRDPERVQRVLEAAKKQFSEHGFEGSSVDAIAKASGVSKVTIYSYFPTKADLFHAAISHRVAREFGHVDRAMLDPANPRDALSRIGRAFLTLMRSPDVINQHRSLYGAQGTDTAAAAAYYAAGPVPLVNSVAEYLREADRADSLHVRHPLLAADQYLSLFLGLGQIRGLLGLTPPSKRENDALLKANVELFLHGYAR